MALRMKEFVKRYGERYSQELGINLKKESFKWFLASVLLGVRISEKIALNTYREFDKRDITMPKKILNAGWNKLVEVLDAGGYVRYDFKTADKLFEVAENLIKNYGTLEKLHSAAKDPADLERKLKSLGKGIGEITVNIFLREMRDIWDKAEPEVKGLALQAAKNLGIKDVKKYWKENLSKINFVCFETALLRLGKDFCRKGKCSICPVKYLCALES